MIHRFARRLSAALLPLLAGCGTVANLVPVPPATGEMRVYGGVATDLDTARQMSAGAAATDDPVERCLCYANAALAVLDVPLSAVGDTLTLPVTVAAGAAVK